MTTKLESLSEVPPRSAADPGSASRPLSVLVAATRTYPDGLGGRETYVYEMSRALAGLGHSVTLVTGFARPLSSWRSAARACASCATL